MSLPPPDKDFEVLLRQSENLAIIKFLTQLQPSAYADVVNLLIQSAEALTDVKYYCPDVDNHAWYVAHTRGNIIFAAALGMSGLMFRLPAQAVSGAQMKGGELVSDLGDNWVMFNPFWPEKDNPHKVQELQHWCRLAYHHALSQDTGL
jgi:hypothetical protein